MGIEQKDGSDDIARTNESFMDEPNQETAQKEYDSQVNESLSGFSGKLIHKDGDFRADLLVDQVVSRGGRFQRMKEPLNVGVESIDYGWASSKQLPDGSIVHFPSNLIIEPTAE